MAQDEAYRKAEKRIEKARRTGEMHLDLSHLGLISVPESLGHLTQLLTLNLSVNRLTTLPESICHLTQLQLLDLSHNQLTTLPESFGRLTQLWVLHLFDNELTVLPESLGQLTQLQDLVLTANQLTALPESLGALRSLIRLYLHGNPALRIPPSVLGPGLGEEAQTQQEPTNPQVILAYYFGKGRHDAKPLNEVKLLLVGHGRVGKTSLCKALRGVAHNPTEPETPGIERRRLILAARRSEVTAHVWDFGGQEFLYQTHQFFFSENSIYLIVLDGRGGERPMREVEYWLRLVRARESGSPVIIVLNQVKAHPFTVDEYYLQENYPEVKTVVQTDCHPRYGIETLKKLLGRVVGGMESLRRKIPPAWLCVRARLEVMEESLVAFDEYRKICEEEGVGDAEEQETLATILDCLGIALNYRSDSRLRETSILKPRWLVDGVYTVLRYVQKRETNGELRIEDFPKALEDAKTYPPEMHEFLLRLMEKFELCFPLKDEDGVHLVPALLNANQPRELKEFLAPGARRIQFRYEDMRPLGLLPRFIVRSHTLAENGVYWQRGVVLRRGTARALVRGDYDGRVTDVYALGDSAEDRVWLTEFIVSEMRVLNDRLRVRTLVESEEHPGAWSELEILQDAARRNETQRTEHLADGKTVAVNVERTLREVESAEASAPDGEPLPLFICYAHADERLVKQLVPSLKVLARRGHIAPWRDTDLVPGEFWDETIRGRLANASIVLFMVSRHFLASDYITNEERPLAMQLVKEKRAVVVPVLLADCTWQVEDFAEIENLPRKGRLVVSYKPRDEAWALVERGIVAAAAKAREGLGLRGRGWERGRLGGLA